MTQTQSMTEIEQAIRSAIEDGDYKTAARTSREHGVALIYRVTCSQGYSIHDAGTGYSLHGWGVNTPYFTGTDDDGTLYKLPEGYQVHQSQDEMLMIYQGNYPCSLLAQKKTVCVVGARGGIVGLSKAA